LSQRQLTYAALDALAAVLIFDSLTRSDAGFAFRAAAARFSRQFHNGRGKKRAVAE